MSADDATELGELSARLHAASTPLPERPYGVLDGHSALLFRLPDLLDRVADGDVFTTARIRAQAVVDRLWASAGTPRQLHGDLTAGNVVRTREALVPIDFQDMFWGHRGQDIANTLFSYLRHDDGTRAGYFRSGYERHMPWPGFRGVELDDHFAARRLMMVNLAITLDRPGVDDYLTVHAGALREYGSSHVGVQT